MSKTKKKLVEEASEETNRHPRYTVRKKLGKEKDILTDRQTDRQVTERQVPDRSQTGRRSLGERLHVFVQLIRCDFCRSRYLPLSLRVFVPSKRTTWFIYLWTLNS